MTPLARALASHPQRTGLLISLAGIAIYGLYPSLSRAVYADGGNLALVLIVATWIRGLLLLGYCLATSERLFVSREDRKQALIGGICQAGSSFSIFFALVYLAGPLVQTIYSMHTIMLLLFLAWRHEIRLDAANVLTTLFALFGLTLVLDVWHPQPAGNWLGIILAFASALIAVSRLHIYAQQTKCRNPAVVGAENFLVAAVLTFLILFFQMPVLPGSWEGIGYTLACGFSLGLATFCMFHAISVLGAFRYSLIGKLEPIFTALFSVLILNEVLAAYQYLGIILVVGSLAVYEGVRHKRLEAHASATTVGQTSRAPS